MSIEGKPFVLRSSGQEINITASLGISCNSPNVETPEQLLKEADNALYDAKRAGRNRVVAAAA
jgi:two-component system cell cycle response regulator